ncbi:hypothetical protein [Zobellia sp. 1_MG-2023]|uniref:hypothetical protein n=1 Tax=Zobellia sp. 1_MG-2023 TaxID=3062626 RepID=UPI0026E34C1B|nr:hypothetical protein [Zobellia sp. 1_MG-2023]MDO6818679.1 hypothetical protein [Zobellia sp. 1_MG-2023]
MTKTEKRTDFLFPRRSYLTGVGSVLDIFATRKKFNTSKSGELADYKALAKDWEMVGEDFKEFFKTLSK